MNKTPAILIIGTESDTKKYTLNLLQKKICKNNGCGNCVSCHLILSHQHHQMLWLSPEKKYTLESLDPLNQKIEFSLDIDEHFFFILEKADLLNNACSNSLLKIIEEPPRGYHFLFLTHHAHHILPTIRSRCQLVNVGKNYQTTDRPFLNYFMEKPTTPSSFLKDLTTQSPEEHEIATCLDVLLHHWTELFKKSINENNPILKAESHHMITILKKASLTPVMPGSGKIFWRNLFLMKDKKNEVS